MNSTPPSSCADGGGGPTCRRPGGCRCRPVGGSQRRWRVASRHAARLRAPRPADYRPHTCFLGELLPEIYSIALAHVIHRVPYHWLLGESTRSARLPPLSRVRGAIRRLARRRVLPRTERDRERAQRLRERALREREVVEAALLVMERIRALAVAAAACEFSVS